MNRRKSSSRAVGPAALALCATVAVALAGCSVAKKADVFDWFDSDDKPGDQANKPLSPDEPYPNLADVPGRPARPPAIDRDKIAQGLVADRENAQYTEDVLRRAPEAAAAPPRPAVAATRPAPSAPPAQTASAPPPAAPSAPPVQTASPPPPAISSAPLPPAPAPMPSAPPAQAANVPAVTAPPASAYAQPADVPVDPNAPAVKMVNNRPVVSAGFYGTEPPPTPAPSQAASQIPNPPPIPIPAAPPTPALSQAAPASSTALDPLQRQLVAPPPVAASGSPADAKPSPVAVARSENVAVRPTEPAPQPAPAAPTDVAPIPHAAAPTPASPSPQVASLPPTAPPAGTPPDQLDRALRQTFPDAAARQGIDALAATIYFGDGATGLTEDDRGILREVARLYRERGGAVRVVGYASPEASGRDLVARRVANLEVSGRRADAVSRELNRFGVPAGVITSSAEGSPSSPGTAGGGFGAAGERRVDIYLDY